MQKRGAFIVIEGLDGSGKTTQAKLLTAKLSRSHNAVYTAEPSHGKIGTFIRNRCLYSEKRLSSTTEALLFAADRIEHVENEIKPALSGSKLVICDRYVYSSLAYQGSADLSVDWIADINKHALKPDLAIFIDVAPEKVLQRLNRRKSVMETLETQQKVRDVYMQFVAKGDLTRINGDMTFDQVGKELENIVLKFWKLFESA